VKWGSLLPSTYPTLSHTQCVQTCIITYCIFFLIYIMNSHFLHGITNQNLLNIIWNTHKIHYIDLKFECIFIVVHCTCITHLQNFGIKTFGFFDFEPYLQSLFIFLLFWAFNKNGLKKRCLHSRYLKMIIMLFAFTFECNNIWQDILQRLSKWYCWMQQYLTRCITKA